MLNGTDDYQARRPGMQGGGHIVYEEVTAFSTRQRLNRLRFACYSLAATFVLVLLSVLVWVLLTAALGPAAKPWIGISIALLVLAGAGYMVALAVRRLHDTGRNGWWAMLLLAPVLEPLALGADSAVLLLFVLLLQPFLGIFLLANPPHPGMNTYGTPNPPNGVLVKLFGSISWAVSMVLLVVQIVVAVLVVTAPEKLDPYVERIERLERQLERSLR